MEGRVARFFARRAASRRLWRLLGALAVLSVVLFVAGRFDNPLTRHLRALAVDLTAPVLGAVDGALGWTGRRWAAVRDLWHAHEENARLRLRIAELEAALADRRGLERENAELRRLLAFHPLREEPVASGRLVGLSGGPFLRSGFVNLGRADGVAPGDPVVASEGLVGRVIEVGRRAARVLLVNDLNSRVPVRVGRAGVPAIAVGRNRKRLSLVFAPPDAAVQVGDMVVTSGADGVFAPDIPVGTVEAVGAEILVRPAVSLSRTDHVRVLKALRRDLFLAPPADCVRACASQAPQATGGGGR